MKIYEDEHSMEIEIPWFQPMAIFMAFFTVIWCGFLVFWYSIAIGTGAPLIMSLFPLIHVAVGLYLIYHTLCMFFNKTYFHLYKDKMAVVHQPIPWFRGNKDYKIDEIEQFYVKEKVTQGKNGTKRSYRLRAKLKNQKDVSILALPEMKAQQAQRIEEMLENFIGINDRPVSGEFQKTRSNAKTARRQRREFDDTLMSNLYFSKIKDLILYKEGAYDVISITQYDWKDGDSHKLLQCTNDQSKELLIYIEQNKALLQAFQEEELPLGITMEVDFNKTNPAYSLELGNKKFYLDSNSKGEGFSSVNNVGIATEQWLYKTTDKKSYIRIVDQGGQMRFFKGSSVKRTDFSQKLDLNQAPEKSPEYRRNEWDNKDFV